MICCTSADEASKLNVAVASGLAAVNASPTSVNDSVSDVAANTVMSPATPAAVAGARRRGRRARRRRWSPLTVVVGAAQAAATSASDGDGDDEQTRRSAACDAL